MSTLKRLDIWMGKNVFIPPIIAFCHATRQTQHETAGCLFITAFFLLCWDILQEASSSWEYLLIPLYLFFIVSIYRDAFIVGSKPAPTPLIRYVAWFFLAANAFLWLANALTGRIDDLRDEIFWALIVAAEYALAIDTLPPRRKRDARADSAKVRKEA